jgi:signal transduction histidine kinase/CHASE1-domain containing sensor protein
MERRPASLPALLRSHAAPAVVLLTGVLSAAGAALSVSRVVAVQQEARFRAEVSASVETLRDRIEAYTAMLRATRGLFEAVGEEPDLGTFRRFVASLEIARQYRGIQGIGWAKALLPAELEEHEAQMRAWGRPDYRVWPPGDRPLYSSITKLEPLDWRNQRAIGYDMFSDPVRREAMERARDTGHVAASGKVELVQETETDVQAGFLMYLPVYARPVGALEERRRLLLGWVYAPFRAENLLAGTLGELQERTFRFEVFDGREQRGENLLYASGAGEGPAQLTRLERLEIAGRPWTLRYVATRAFASRTERILPAAVLAAGLAVTALLFWITRADAQGRARAEKEARRSSFLADAGKALSASMEVERTVAEVAALAARRVADACLVVLVDPGGPTWFAGHRDPAVAGEAAGALRGTGPADAAPLAVQAALASGEPRLAELPPALPAGGAAAAALRVLGARSLLAVPLLARGEPLGAIVLLSTRPRAFAEEDLPPAQDLARLVAAAVDTARLYRRAQEAVAARDEFLSIASHELKTPLTSLTLHADSLRNAARRGTPEQIAGKADAIRRSVDRLARLVSSLLDISRIGAGRLDLELEELDLAEVAREVVDRFEDEARRARCTIALDAEPARGRWDRTRLDQVLTNLLSNALKYGPEKPVLVRVESAGDRAVLSVQDRGIGISEGDQRRIFQRFERAVSRRNYGGFGLGLWIVRQIVEALGGTVRVESVPGRGSTFTVELLTWLHAAPPAAGERRAGPPDRPLPLT